MKKIITLLALLLFTVGATQLNAQLLDRSGWSITTSSEGDDSSSGHASAIIDGNVSTYWHSYWSGMSNPSGYKTAELPQFFVVDMGSEQTFKTIGYIPRPLSNSALGNGTAYEWKLYVSNEAFSATNESTAPSTIVNALGEHAMSGTWTYDDNFNPNSQIQTATNSTELSGRYVMFVITSAKGDKYGSCAEFFLSKDESIDYPTVTYASSFEDNQAISLNTTPAKELKTNQWYAIKNNTKGYWQDQQSGAWKTVNSASINEQKANDKAGFLFKLEDAGEGKYNIISGNGISVRLTLDGWGSSNADNMKPFETFTIAQIGDNEGYFYIQQTSNSAIADGNGSVVGWGTSAPTNINGNNVHQFYEVSLVEAQDYHITPSNDKVYTVSTATRGNWAYDPLYAEGDFKGTDALVSTKVGNSENTNITEENQKYFAILKSDKGNYYIYSVAGKKFVSADGSIAPLSVAPKTSNTQLIDNEANSSNYPYVVEIDDHQIAISNGYTSKGGIISWNDLKDEGNQVRFTEVEGVTADVTVALARIALFEGMSTTYNIGSGYGQYSDPNNAYTNALTAAQNLIADADATADGLKVALTNLTNAVAALTFNVPADGAFIRVKSHNSSNAYLAAENSSETNYTTRAAFSTNADATTIFCYKDGYLVNYSTGLYLCSDATNFAGYNGVQTAGTKVNFAKNTDVTADGAGLLYVKFNENARYLYAADENRTDAGNGTPNNIHYTFDLEAVESLPVTIGEAGYATIYAPQALRVPEGVTAYTVSKADDSKVYLDEIADGVIPANTGVVLKAAAGAYTLTVTTTENTATSLLSGIVPTTKFATTDGNPYVLANKNSVVGFYVMNSATDRDIHGFRAFYNAPAASDADLFAIDLGPVDGIGTIIGNGEENVNAPIYDLSGRRVLKADKGVYIRNGKKIYVK